MKKEETDIHYKSERTSKQNVLTNGMTINQMTTRRLRLTVQLKRQACHSTRHAFNLFKPCIW